MNSLPGRLDACSHLAFLATSSFSISNASKFCLWGSKCGRNYLQASKLHLLRRPRVLAEQLTNLSRERSEEGNLKKHLPIRQEHGKTCCLFYVGRSSKAQHHSIWLTDHWNFKTQRSDSALGKIRSYWALGLSLHHRFIPYGLKLESTVQEPKEIMIPRGDVWQSLLTVKIT